MVVTDWVLYVLSVPDKGLLTGSPGVKADRVPRSAPSDPR